MPLYDDDPTARPENQVNVGPTAVFRNPGDLGWMQVRYYEAPREDPGWAEVYVYTDAMSYAPGETVQFHGSTNAAAWTLEVTRDGWKPEVVYRKEGLAGQSTPMPKDAYLAGCDWPVLHTFRLPDDLRSGFYLVEASVERAQGGRFVQHHFFVVRPTPATRRGRMLQLLPTCTWTAYNDWGGANHYFGIHGPTGGAMSPVLSTQRPWTRGMLKLPEGAPRITAPIREPMAAPRYENKEWSYANGYGYIYAAAGWAQYDRHFVTWAEREGYEFDTITQTDLHNHPELLDGYSCVTIIGHDEYWTREMRLTMEAYVERGGHLARFGANFVWQVRLEEGGRRQVCYKDYALDPVSRTEDTRTGTTAWEDHRVKWPGASTVGVNGFGGIYANWGRFSPRGSRGLTVYRPDHWVFANTDLSYADIFGNEAAIFGYEVDGLSYTFRDGLPYPTGEDGAATDIAILAMTPAMMAEAPLSAYGYRPYLGSHDWYGLTRSQYGEVTDETLRKTAYGSGMMVAMRRGRGEVVTAATCEWVMGLRRGCFYTQQITRNILDAFTAAASGPG